MYMLTYCLLTHLDKEAINGFHKLKFGCRIIKLYPPKKRIQKSNQRGAQTNTSYQLYSWIRDNRKAMGCSQ